MQVQQFYGFETLKNNTMIKTELIKLFEKIGNETDTFAPFITCDEFENLADEIVKLLNLHIVTGMLPNDMQINENIEKYLPDSEEYKKLNKREQVLVTASTKAGAKWFRNGVITGNYL